MAPGWSPSESQSLSSVLCRGRVLRFDAHSIVDGKAQILLAAEVAFRGLDQDVSKQELDLIQLAASNLAEPRAAASKIMREFLNTGTRRGGANDFS